MAATIDRQVYLAAILRMRFPFFLRKVFETVSPGDELCWSWHLGAIGWQLERVRNGDSRPSPSAAEEYL